MSSVKDSPEWLQALEREITPRDIGESWSVPHNSIMEYGVICQHDEYILCPCRAAALINKIKQGISNGDR